MHTLKLSGSILQLNAKLDFCVFLTFLSLHSLLQGDKNTCERLKRVAVRDECLLVGDGGQASANCGFLDLIFATLFHTRDPCSGIKCNYTTMAASVNTVMYLQQYLEILNEWKWVRTYLN